MEHLAMFVCLFFWIRNRLVPRGQLPREDLRRASLPPRPLVTPGPRCSSCPLSPLYLCHASCVRSVHSPVLLSCTDILPTIWSVPFLSSCPTHIFNPQKYEPLKPHTWTVLLNQFQQTYPNCNSQQIISPHTSSMPTYFSVAHLHKWLPSSYSLNTMLSMIQQ